MASWRFFFEFNVKLIEQIKNEIKNIMKSQNVEFVYKVGRLK